MEGAMSRQIFAEILSLIADCWDYLRRHVEGGEVNAAR